VKFHRDKSKGLDRFLEKIMKKYYRNDPIHFAKVLYCFWIGEKKSPEGNDVLGFARILTPRERDIFGYDFLIAIDKKHWRKSKFIDRVRLAIHEIRHCIVVVDEETGEPKEDKDGRIKIKIRPHEISLNLFLYEVKKCGLSDGERKVVKSLLKADRSFRKRR